ncbi:hypothetical protein QT231_22385 [Halomonas sp. SpR1]|uniref:hypothetical protein n=1 Tax=Halomonas sp. SpR1 TaxID=3050462 RepID=UPI0027E470D0|nr:hypothetical protein [Halomonas sp. SpR1]MDQ7735459.1 hypothetical protein [Halomonas sp. SpR1]
MPKRPPLPTPDDANWYEHNQMNFWLWACLEDAEQYLELSKQCQRTFDLMFSDGISSMKRYEDEFRLLEKKQQLNAYHFILTTGNLLRVFERARHMFPEIEPTFTSAQHLNNEARELRDLVEHTHGRNGYIAGWGNNPDRYERRDGPQPGVLADATSTIINEKGHWLGGRLCVETIHLEVSRIIEVAKTIPAPTDYIP